MSDYVIEDGDILDEDEELLFGDNLYLRTQAVKQQKASAATPSVKSTATGKLTEAKSSTRKKGFDIAQSSGPGCAACVLCFGGVADLRQCRKCFLKVCSNCRNDKDMSGKGTDKDWTCGDCTRGGSGLEVLLSAPEQKRVKVTKTGEGPRRGGAGKRRTFKRRRT